MEKKRKTNGMEIYPSEPNKIPPEQDVIGR